jgi:hypothetical protein
LELAEAWLYIWVELAESCIHDDLEVWFAPVDPDVWSLPNHGSMGGIAVCIRIGQEPEAHVRNSRNQTLRFKDGNGYPLSGYPRIPDPMGADVDTSLHPWVRVWI